jgi:hypothetical protein
MKNLENPEQNLRYQTIDDVKIKRVSEDDPDFDSAIDIFADDDNEAELEIKKKLIAENWWLQPEWQEKGEPQEQIDVTIGDYKISVYNFGELLAEQHLEELKSAIENISKVAEGKLLKQVKYILISNVSKFNPQSEENFRGQGAGEMQAIEIFPEGRELVPYGRIEGVSNFESILIHEFSHSMRKVDMDFINAWQKKFWKYIKDVDKRRKMNGVRYAFQQDPVDPQKCVSKYAQTTSDEDICESMVAALINPEVLDNEKLELTSKKLLSVKKNVLQIQLAKKSGQEVKLPEIDGQIKYKAEPSGIMFKPL